MGKLVQVPHTPVKAREQLRLLERARRRDERGRALCVAASLGDLEVVRALCNGGVSASAKWMGSSALWMAVFTNKAEVARFLLRNGASKDAGNEDGLTPLGVAAKKGLLDLVEALCAAGADTEKADSAGRTPFWHAAEAGHVEVLRILADHGANVAAPDEDGDTPLSAAAANDQLKAVAFLDAVDRAARFVKNCAGRTPTGEAAFAGHIATLRYLQEIAGAPLGEDEEDDAGHNAFFSAAAHGHTTVLLYTKRALGLGTSARDLGGDTALHLAAKNGHLAVVEELVLDGADLEALNADGWSPLAVACMANQSGIASYLSCELPREKILDQLEGIPRPSDSVYKHIRDRLTFCDD